MSTANNAENSKKTRGPSEVSKSGKKGKSTGFIETTGYKPNWLETGPLTPEMLPADPGDPEVAELINELSRHIPIEEGPGTPTDISSTQSNLGEIDIPITDEVSPEDLEAVKVYLKKHGQEHQTKQETESPALIDVAPPAAEQSVPVDSTDDKAAAAGQLTESLGKIELREENVVLAALVKTIEAQKEQSLDEDQESGSSIVQDEHQTSADIAYSGDERQRQATAASPALSLPPAAGATPRRVAREKPKKRRDRLSVGLLFFGILLLTAAAFLYLTNPFTRLALGSASLARPVSPAEVVSPRSVRGEWCLTGDFLETGAATPQLVDTGRQGDILSSDRIYSLEQIVAQPGTYQWQVINCADPAIVYPVSPAWLRTDDPGQQVTFIFDSNEREDPLFFPIPFVVTTEDSADRFRVIGSFQDWNPDDTSSQLTQLYGGLYQQVRNIATSGTYEAYIIDEVSQQAIDAYGRATKPIPFSFETKRNGETVVFLYDTDRGRASVLHNMSPLFAMLAFEQGYLYIVYTLLGLASLLFLGLLLRQWLLRNRSLWLESGCPSCGEHELMRIARRKSDRYLNWLDIPAYRYRCRHCTWEGIRLSEEGASVSPGVTTTSADIYR